MELAMAGLAVMYAIGAGVAAKACEALESDSAAFLNEYKSRMVMRWSARGKKARPWIFKRQTVAIRAGTFVAIEGGFFVACMVQLLDQTVNLIFMIDNSVTMWLIPTC